MITTVLTHLQVFSFDAVAQPLNLRHDEVHVGEVAERVVDDDAEEVDQFLGGQRLVADHDGSFLHHPRLDRRCHL